MRIARSQRVDKACVSRCLRFGEGSFVGYQDGYTYMQTLLTTIREARDGAG